VKYTRFIVFGALVGLAAPAAAQSVKAGIQAWQKSDYSAAVKIWRPLAEKGDPDAQFNLAQAYRLGRGVPTNLAAAQTWLERAAGQGHVDAQTTLGLLLFEGGNRTAGVRWLKMAAEKDDPRAMLVYGTALFNGDGVTQNASGGYALVSRAAAKGLAAAKATLAQMKEVMPPEARKKVAAAIARSKPAAKPVPAKTAATKQPKPTTAPAASAAAARPPASGAWRIQLGAFSQRSAAETLFRKLSGNAALSGRSASYVPAGAVVRLQVGPFESRDAAANACRSLSSRGQACFPVSAK
jgi:cell division septation protein DedD